jgi:hypothetical protein
MKLFFELLPYGLLAWMCWDLVRMTYYPPKRKEWTPEQWKEVTRQILEYERKRKIKQP